MDNRAWSQALAATSADASSAVMSRQPASASAQPAQTCLAGFCPDAADSSGVSSRVACTRKEARVAEISCRLMVCRQGGKGESQGTEVFLRGEASCH